MFEQECVREFHLKYGHPAPDKPSLAHFRFMARAKWLIEEVLEYAYACGYSARASVDSDGKQTIDLKPHATGPGLVPPFDWVEMIDALIDIEYFALGSFVEMGIDGAHAFMEIHRSNMSKSTDKTPDGKTIKGSEYMPPDIKRVLAYQQAGGSHLGSEIEVLRGLVKVLTMARDQSSTRIQELQDERTALAEKVEYQRKLIDGLMSRANNESASTR